MSTESRLFTVGHSNHNWDRFLELLRSVGITAIADVRSSPYSKWLPYFSRPELQKGLRDAGIEYFFLGDHLGGRPSDSNLYDESGRIDYERVRRTSQFEQGVEQILDYVPQFSVAMLCAEEDPLTCHRGLMITPALVEIGVAPLHLRGDGRVETTAEMEDRLLAETGVGEGILNGLFAATISAVDRAELLRQAYREMGRSKGFRRADNPSDPEGSLRSPSGL